jgi:2-oxoglutarate ferredoxin oxidoreductase subunit alpha
MLRLLQKFDTARGLVPAPVVRVAHEKTRFGVIYFGSTAPAMDEALATLADDGVHIDALRLRAFPFPDSVLEFIAVHEQVFVVEQNRDGQMRSLLINEGQIDPARLTAVLHFEGAPITARFIIDRISELLGHTEPAPREAAE